MATNVTYGIGFNNRLNINVQLYSTKKFNLVLKLIAHVTFG